MYTDVQWLTKIRLELLKGGISKREILRREQIHWETLKKILHYLKPPGYRINTPRTKPKIVPFLSAFLKSSTPIKAFQKKCHTAKRIYECIKEESCQSNYT